MAWASQAEASSYHFYGPGFLSFLLGTQDLPGPQVDFSLVTFWANTSGGSTVWPLSPQQILIFLGSLVPSRPNWAS